MAPDIQGYKKKVFFDEYNVKINLVPPLLLTSLLWKFDHILQGDSVKYVHIYLYIFQYTCTYQFVKKILISKYICVMSLY